MTDTSPPSNLTHSYLDLLAPNHEAGLTIGGHAVEAIAGRFGTPCYIYDAAILRQRLQSVVQSLGTEVLYSLKANPSLAVADVLRQAGAGAEVTSAGEILVAQRAGFDSSRMQFVGPGKSSADLRLAVESGVGCIHLESAGEYDVLAELAGDLGTRPRVGIRVNPIGTSTSARIRMSGGSQKFGVDDDAVGTLLERILTDDLVEFRGLHCFTGSQCFDAGAWLQSCAELLDLARQIETEHSIQVPVVDLGGGFGVPCFEDDPEFDLAAAGSGLRSLLQDHSGREVFVELGRYLTAPAGIYVSRVNYLKNSDGRRFAILDGGMHHHGAAAGVGAVLRRPFPIVLARDPLAVGGEAVTLCGPLCTPMDNFVDDLAMPELQPGDLVAVLCSGAYGLCFSQAAFNGHPTPAEVLVDRDSVSLVRAAGRAQDTLRGQFLPGEA
ncbi:MAG: diaminopimelate decarboxylase [Planctomycetota bacterium]|nr:diaminopimelate decarboxylase [Planctomycetota bacterium]